MHIQMYVHITCILYTGELGLGKGKVNRTLCMIMCGQSKALNMYDLVIARAQINKYVHMLYMSIYNI